MCSAVSFSVPESPESQVFGTSCKHPHPLSDASASPTGWQVSWFTLSTLRLVHVATHYSVLHVNMHILVRRQRVANGLASFLVFIEHPSSRTRTNYRNYSVTILHTEQEGLHIHAFLLVSLCMLLLAKNNSNNAHMVRLIFS